MVTRLRWAAEKSFTVEKPFYWNYSGQRGKAETGFR
jgi:hypothetical protein